MKPLLLTFFAFCCFLTSSAQSVRASLSSHVPATGAVNVPTYLPLIITFNQAVSKGVGNIYLRNRSLSATLLIPVSSPNVTISDSIVYVAGVSLDGGSFYHVTIDSAAFESAGYNCYGLYDTSTWWFKTIGPAAGTGSVATTTNPASLTGPASNGLFILNCALPAAAIIDVSVYDLAGRVVARQWYTGKAGENSLRLQTAASAGTYIIRVDCEKTRSVIKADML